MGQDQREVLRRGGDVRFLIEQLTEVPAATGGAMIASQQRYRPSVVAAIGGILEKEFIRLGLLNVTTPRRRCLHRHVTWTHDKA
jgi:hypothetical protein